MDTARSPGAIQRFEVEERTALWPRARRRGRSGAAAAPAAPAGRPGDAACGHSLQSPPVWIPADVHVMQDTSIKP